MAFTKNNITVLVAPLDWGLGHATRCIPIIRELLKNGCHVLIAASEKPAMLLAKEFPELEILPLTGYNIRYGKGNLMFQLAKQLPSFFRSIRSEHLWLEKAVADYRIDAVISDNRYGLYHSGIPCVFITHQLQVQAPGWLKWTEKLVQKKLYGFIEKFKECWVPDIQEARLSLGKNLSHPQKMPVIPVRYIGWLTRFSPQPPAAKRYQLLISLSGPEPQRTLLEKKLVKQLPGISGQVLLIRGCPDTHETGFVPPENVMVVNHLMGNEMQMVIARSEFFLSRCGYSTLMDLQAVDCRCIFVPTPGQTEQEYLGREMTIEKKAVVSGQQELQLNTALEQAAFLSPVSAGTYVNQELAPIIREWLAMVGKS